MKVQEMPAASHPTHGDISEHLILRTLQPSQARRANLRRAALGGDMMAARFHERREILALISTWKYIKVQAHL